jgi:hypothetical protein
VACEALLGSRAVASLPPANKEKFLRDVVAGKSLKDTPKPTGNKVKRPRGGVATEVENMDRTVPHRLPATFVLDRNGPDKFGFPAMLDLHSLFWF